MVTKNTQRLTEVGPIDPRTGFPLWYEDAADPPVRLELVWKPGDAKAPVVIEPEESGPLRNILAFPGEAFYMLAEARMVSGGGPRNGRVRVVLALEATFGGAGDVVDGQQIVFGRTRFRIDDAVPDQTYTLTHPYGVMQGKADAKGRVFVTEDIGVTPLAFSEALGGRIAPFLRWTPDPALDPTTHIGDGDTAHTITGSPFDTNFVVVEGPGIGSAGGQPDPTDPDNPNKIYTDLFVLQGRIATLNGADVPRAVYSGTGGSVTVDVFARSVPGQTLALSLDGGADTNMRGGTNGSRHYFARVDAGTTVPHRVAVRNTQDPTNVLPPTEADVTDAVEITEVDYDSASQTLTVQAVSSDQASPRTLTLTARSLPDTVLDAAGSAALPVDAPPPEVTVTSDAKGTGTRTVKVVG